MMIKFYDHLNLSKVCCEENIFTCILSNSHMLLHVVYATHFTIRKSKTLNRNFESCP